MPMIKPEDFGTNKDSSINKEYCTYCFQKGEFTMPAKNVQEMIEKLVSMHDQMGMTEKKARIIASENLPKLKRWSRV
jgi:radical SAM superfamily enzyme